MPALHSKQIKLHLQAVPDWSKRAQTIFRTFKFKGFLKGTTMSDLAQAKWELTGETD
jgi:hypothetical protein